MSKRKARAASPSSEPETIEVLRAKLAKAEGKKSSKKARTCKTNSNGVKNPASNGDGDEENVDPAGNKRVILVKCVPIFIT